MSEFERLRNLVLGLWLTGLGFFSAYGSLRSQVPILAWSLFVTALVTARLHPAKGDRVESVYLRRPFVLTLLLSYASLGLWLAAVVLVTRTPLLWPGLFALAVAIAAVVVYHGRLYGLDADSSRLMNSNHGMIGATVFLSLASYAIPILTVGAGAGLIYASYVPTWDDKKPLFDLTLE